MTESPPSITTIYVNDAPRRHAPLATTGVIGWIRGNLFPSVFDSLLTVASALFLIAAIVSLIQWTISGANWYSVTRNLSNLMIGSMQADPDAMNRVNIMTLLLAFGVGISLRAWSRVGLRGWIGIAIIATLMLIIPALISPIPLPPSFITSGSISVVSGSVTEIPQNTMSFIGAKGELIRLRLASTITPTDAGLAGITAFTDRAADALIASASVRLQGQGRIEEVQRLIESSTTPAPDRATLTTELDALRSINDLSIVDIYALNGPNMTIRLLAADGETVLAEAELTQSGDEFTFTLPESGWYILERTVKAENANTLLEMNGVYPVLERGITRARLDADGQPVMDARSGQPQVVSITQHIRVTDDFLVETPQPKQNGTDVARYLFVNNQYRGERPLDDFLVLHLGPFTEKTRRLLLPCLALIALGYAAMQFLDRSYPPIPPTPKPSRRIVFWMWAIMPILIYILIASTDARSWGGLFLTFILTAVGIVVSFPIGVLLALGRRAEGLPAVKYFCIGVIELVRGVPLITVLFLASLALPLVNPSFSEVPGAVRAMVAITIFSAAYLAENVRGGLQSVPSGQTEAAKALGMNPPQVTLFITLPQALRAVIPTLVGQCISLFKDTSLVAIVGLSDLTRVADTVVAQAEYIGLRRETYLFIAAVYFVFSFVMAYVSRKIEDSGSGVARQVKL